MLCTDLDAHASDYSRRYPQKDPPTRVRPVTTLEEPAPAAVAPTKPKTRAPTVLRRVALPELTEEQEAQVKEMLSLATSLGYVCQPCQGLKMDLAQQIYSRMTNRLGKSIFQVIDFNISFPRQAALQLFPDSLQETCNEKSITWRTSTILDALALMGDLLASVSRFAAGLTRAVTPPSESQIRVWSTMLPTIWVNHIIQEHGAERLNFKASYVLWDNYAELNPPKDDDKRNIEIGLELERELRVRLLQDIFHISESGAPLSANCGVR